LTGERVFGAASPMKLLMQHVHAEPQPPSYRARQRVSRDVDDFVMACLNKNPDRRPASAEELIHLACVCRTDDSWDQRSAKTWWEMNLPRLTTPGLPAPQHGVDHRALTVQ
jgi:eukaryotic-like serine/threonine-protein kinase